MALQVKSGRMTDGALLDHIARLPHARANFKQLVRELRLRGDDRAELETALARLAARGDLIETRSGYFALTSRSREFAVGRLQMHRDGYGFLISDRPMEGINGTSSFRPNPPKGPCTATVWWFELRGSKREAGPTAKSSRFWSARTLPWWANSASGAVGLT